MTNPRQKMENDMCWLLKKILSNEDISQLDQEQMFALYECVKNEYVTGIKIAIMASGRIVSDTMKPRVTKKGLEFLYPDEKLSAKNITNEGNQPDKRNSAQSKDKEPKIFYKSTLFWTIVGSIAGVGGFIWMIITHFNLV